MVKKGPMLKKVFKYMAVGIAGFVLGGAIFGGVYGSQASGLTNDLSGSQAAALSYADALKNKTASYDALSEEYSALNITHIDLQEDYDGVVKELIEANLEEKQDSDWMDLADEELDSSLFDDKAKKFLNDEGYNVEDEEDVTSWKLVEPWDVSASDEDREDGDAVLKGEVKLYFFEDGDEDKDDHVYANIKVVIKENEVHKVKLSPL